MNESLNSEKTYAIFDRSQYPLIVINFTGEKANDENFQDYLNGLSENYNGNEKIKILFEATNANFPGLKFQKLQGQWMKDNNDVMKSHCMGIAYVIPSLVIRNALNLIFTIQSQPVPFKVFETKEMALHWLDSL